MSMKKAIAAALVVGTMTMTGAAFAGPRFHDRHGSSHALRWEQQKHHGSHHVEIDRHRRPGQSQVGKKGWPLKEKGVRGKSPIFTPGGGRNPQPGGYRPGGHGGKRPSPRPMGGMGGGRGPRPRGWR